MAEREPETVQSHAEPIQEQKETRVIHAKGSISSDNADEKSIDETLIETPEGEEPTQHERSTLRHVGESLPFAVWLVAIIELCERFTYYGCQGIFQNYISRPLDGTYGRGGLGMGSQGATGLTTTYTFWCYLTPLLGGYIADTYLGKYKTILAFCSVYFAGLLILVCTSIPSSLSHGAGLGGYITSILLTGLGTGGIKANVAPLIAEQYKRRTMAIGITKQGERVVIDPYVTIQRIFLIFYWCINFGALSLLATPYLERDVGFWSAYVLCLCMFCIGITVLVLGRKQYVDRPPTGSVVGNAFKMVGLMIKHRHQDAAKPSWRAEHGIQKPVAWDDKFVDEVKRALNGCKVFAIYPIFWVCYGQFSNNFVTQAGQMALHGIPNDLMQNFDPIAIIIFVPIMDRLVYPFLRKLHIPVPPITRIILGFVIMAIAMAYAAIVQHLIYQAGPCYSEPLCEASFSAEGVAQGNNVHVAIQTPAYMLIGIAEIFASATGYEYAYTKAPPAMKSFVQSLFLLTNAFGSALGNAFVPAAKDPDFLWLYTGLACGCAAAAVLIWILFGKLNKTEEEMNYIETDIVDGPDRRPSAIKA